MSAPTPQCPACGAGHAPGDRFCADCDAALGPAVVAVTLRTCPRCSSGSLDADGLCGECGAQAWGAAAGLVLRGPGLAAVTDPERRHRENQDAVLLSGPAEGGMGSIAVVCDGVSNSQTPAAAAVMAAQAAFAVLKEAGAGVSRAIMRDAIVAAHAAVCTLPYDRQADVDPPARTLVAAVVRQAGKGAGDHLDAVVGWLGDSRAYMLSDGASALLTHDRSWVNAVVDANTMPLAEALRDRRAHALVHCLGTTDFAAFSPCPEPAVRTVALPGRGWLLLCTDGLWNYAENPAAMLRACPGISGMEAGPVCTALLHHALIGGGHDNITIAAIQLDADGPGMAG